MSILDRIRATLKENMLKEIQFRNQGITSGNKFDKVLIEKIVARSIISMFPELGIKAKDATDDDLIKLLKKYISQEKERSMYELGYLRKQDVEGKNAGQVKKMVRDNIKELGDELTSFTIEAAYRYLPKQPSKKEITEWINANIDFSKLKNKMQAMNPIMEQFKGCDGNFVKDILITL